jgi:hypothetical protein
MASTTTEVENVVDVKAAPFAVRPDLTPTSVPDR